MSLLSNRARTAQGMERQVPQPNLIVATWSTTALATLNDPTLRTSNSKKEWNMLSGVALWK